jgi:hypothetical protein
MGCWDTAVEPLKIGEALHYRAGIYRRFVLALLLKTINDWMEANTMRQGYMG